MGIKDMFQIRVLCSIAVLAIVALVPLRLTAQDAESEPVFRTGTRLVQVDVVVKAKDIPVEGLKRQDFELFDNGKQRPISVFSIRKMDPEVAPLDPLPPGVITNVPGARGQEPLAATVILIDYLNTTTEIQMWARQQALKYAATAGPREHIAVYTLNATLRVRQTFSNDRVLLERTIKASRPETQMFGPFDWGRDGRPTGMGANAVAAMEANNRLRNAEITSAAFATIARHLSGLPGRKKLIWVSHGLPISVTDETTRNNVTVHDYQNLSERVYAPMKLLNDGNIAMYGIDPTPVGVRSLADPALATLIQLSEMTGGKAYYNTNETAASFRRALTDTDYSYTLGFYPQEQEYDGASHKLQVKLARDARAAHPSSELRYRKNYSAQSVLPVMTNKRREQILDAWVMEPLDATEIAFTARATQVEGRSDHRMIEVALDISQLQLTQENGRWVGQVHLAVVPDGKRKPTGLSQIVKLNMKQETYLNALKTGMLIRNSIQVEDKKGKLLSDRLNVVLLDGVSGKAGSVRIPLK